MKLSQITHSLPPTILGAICALTFGTSALQAADHGDAPNVAGDQAADLADVYFFRDPGALDQAVIITTVRGFIVPSEAVNFANFDPLIRYRLEIENTGDAKADRAIEITFAPRTSASAGQAATLKFINFGLKGKNAIFTQTTGAAPILTTGPTLNPFVDLPPENGAPTQVINDLTVAGNAVKFFAGEVDDPFFFDIPAFARVFGPLSDDDPGTLPNLGDLGRGRDSFAGYNVMAIAIRLPITMLGTPPSEGNYANKIGVDFATQRRVQVPKKTGEIKSVGTFLNIDRMGNPAVNVALIPFARKNEYNAATPLDDAKLRFVGDANHTDDGKKDPTTKQKDLRGIVDTLANIEATLGITINATSTLVAVAVGAGDYLRLDVTAPNSGLGGGDNAGAGFPNGRRLKDDVIDFYLSVLTNGAVTPQTLIAPGGDNVIGNDVPLQNVFPFVAYSQQPRPRVPADPAQADTNVDDKTRN